MHYEHLIQINDPANELLTPIRRDQLWLGLMRRVERPDEFLVGVESVKIVAQGDGWLQREMMLGALKVEDHVRLEHQQAIHFETAPSDQHQGGRFSMQIEEPASGELFVRFSYRTALSDTPGAESSQDDAYFASYVKNAYRNTDIDAIRWIRELLETGELGD